MSLNWDFLMLFFWLDWGYWFLEARAQRQRAISSHCIKGMYSQHDLSLLMFTLIIWLRQCLSTSPSLSIGTLWREVTMQCPHRRKRELCFTHLGRKYLHILFGILLHGKFVYSPPFKCLRNHLFLIRQIC